MLKILLKKRNATIITAIFLLTIFAWFIPTNVQTVSATSLQNPRIDSDGNTVWDCVYFGHYPQSWKGIDGRDGYNNDPIKWRVLSVNENEALLLAHQCLDRQWYPIDCSTQDPSTLEEEDLYLTWEDTYIRKWLNGTESNQFLGKAFTEIEQTSIIEKTIENPNNPIHATSGGNATSDKAFLLSFNDATNSMYGFSNNADSRSNTRWAYPTHYSLDKGAPTNKDERYKGISSWFLRTPGKDLTKVTAVDRFGAVFIDGYINEETVTIRPALYLDLSSNCWSYAGTVSSADTVTSTLPTEPSAIPTEPSPTTPTTQPTNPAPIIPVEPVPPTTSAPTEPSVEPTTPSTDPITAPTNPSTEPTEPSMEPTKPVESTPAKKAQAITTKVASSIKTVYGTKPIDLGIKASGSKYFITKSSNEKVAICANRLYITGPGKAIITIIAPETAEYREAIKKITVTVKPAQIKFSKISSTKKRTLTATWGKQSKVSGYQLLIATDKKFAKSKKIATIKNWKTGKVTVKKLKSGKVYYAKVRAYVKSGSTKIYGSYSDVKKVKVR